MTETLENKNTMIVPKEDIARRIDRILTPASKSILRDFKYSPHELILGEYTKDENITFHGCGDKIKIEVDQSVWLRDIDQFASRINFGISTYRDLYIDHTRVEEDFSVSVKLNAAPRRCLVTLSSQYDHERFLSGLSKNVADVFTSRAIREGYIYIRDGVFCVAMKLYADGSVWVLIDPVINDEKTPNLGAMVKVRGDELMTIDREMIYKDFDVIKSF